ncbi:MAG TPA: L,D-transpeptidase [Vicinamibacterales bacterium]
MRATQAGWTMAAVTVAVALAGVPLRAADAAATVTTAASPRPMRRIIVSLPDRKLAVLENEQVLALFGVAVGAPSTPSPIGTFTIVNRIPHPTYYRPGKVIPPGATNPLGTRWLGLSQKGYGIHGTDNPRSIGHAQSLGCIRLRNADVERLFEHVRAGDIVELHAERTAELAELFK